jgi:hypothetical protein
MLEVLERYNQVQDVQGLEQVLERYNQLQCISTAEKPHHCIERL